jgi:hypothetical protein
MQQKITKKMKSLEKGSNRSELKRVQERFAKNARELSTLEGQLSKV